MIKLVLHSSVAWKVNWVLVLYFQHSYRRVSRETYLFYRPNSLGNYWYCSMVEASLICLHLWFVIMIEDVFWDFAILFPSGLSAKQPFESPSSPLGLKGRCKFWNLKSYIIVSPRHKWHWSYQKLFISHPLSCYIGSSMWLVVVLWVIMAAMPEWQGAS